MAEPRSLPELVAARAAGPLQTEEFAPGVTFAALAGAPARLPAELRFLHDAGPWEVPTKRGIAVLEPLALLIAARAVARAAALHEHDRVALVGHPASLRLRLAGVAAALYAGATVVAHEADDATVVVTEETITVEGETSAWEGWPETCGLAAIGSTWLDRMESQVRDGEVCVRGPLVMAGY